MVLGKILQRFTAGNLFIMLKELRETWNAGTPLATAVPAFLKKYAFFHGLVAFYCIVFSVLQMRKMALAAAPLPPPRPEQPSRRRLRPTISLTREPMVWKEVFAERGLAFTWFGKALAAAIIVISVGYPLWVLWQGPARPPAWGDVRDSFRYVPAYLNRPPSESERRASLRAEINTWVRLVGTAVACLTLLGVAFRAAGSFSGERDRQTLDSLLTTRLSLGSILYAKWLGSILSVRFAWLWLGLVWGMGLLLGGLSVVTLPWLLLMWLVYAGFFACLGQQFSLTSSSTLRATLLTLATMAVFSLGNWTPRLFFDSRPRSFLANEGKPLDLVFTFQAFGLTPPLSLGWFAFHGDEVTAQALGTRRGDDPKEIVLCIAVGLLIWTLAGFILWRLNLQAFALMAHRSPRQWQRELRKPIATG